MYGDVEWEAPLVSAHYKLARMEKVMASGDTSKAEDWKRYDWEFHQALISACGSKLLMETHSVIFDRYLRYQMIALSYRGEVAANEHQQLLDAALRRDGKIAKQVLALHIQGRRRTRAGEGHAEMRHDTRMSRGALGYHPIDDSPVTRKTMLKHVQDPAETVSDVVFRQIRRGHHFRDIAPGTKIKLEQAKERYSIGISSLREILSRLTTENLVVAEGQRGFEVSPASRRELLELADLRIVLETHAIGLAVRGGKSRMGRAHRRRAPQAGCC